MTPEKIAVLVITGVIAVLLSMTLMESADGVSPKSQVRPAPGPAPAEPVPSIEELMRGQGATVLKPPPRPPEAAPPPPAQELLRHRVQPGETLERIALKHLGSKAAHHRILAVNPGLDPRKLQRGQEILIPLPAKAPAATAAAPRGQAPAPAPEGGRSHVVARGESLASIARRHYGRESAWKRIFEANRDRIERPERLVAGTELRIP
jgi:nucleoid-associated protein YgaU